MRPQPRTSQFRDPSRTCSLTKTLAKAGESESGAEIGDSAAILFNRAESAAKRSASVIRLRQAENGRRLWRGQGARITPLTSSPAGCRLGGSNEFQTLGRRERDLSPVGTSPLSHHHPDGVSKLAIPARPRADYGSLLKSHSHGAADNRQDRSQDSTRKRCNSPVPHFTGTSAARII